MFFDPKNMPTLFSRQRLKILNALVLQTTFVIFFLAGCFSDQLVLKMGGGPKGGTFENVARRIAFVLNESMPTLRIRDLPSGGSLANLENVNEGTFDMGLVFAGDAYLGRQGLLGKDIPEQKNVLALARLYGATAHLAVPANSVIRTPGDLKGRRVAIGGAGTGSALTAERFFKHQRLWKNIIPIHEGYATAIGDMKQGNVDAVWLQVGFPSKYLVKISNELSIRFLNLYDEAVTSGFFSDYPFYAAVTIPAGTYNRQDHDIATFQDAALWVANPSLSNETVFDALTVLFSEKGLARMQVLSVGWDLELEKGLMGVKIPLHPGAVQFWHAKGVFMPGIL